MKPIHDETIFQIFKLIGTIILGAILQTMFLSARNIKESTRKMALIITTMMVSLNCWGFQRNIWTTIHFHGVWDKIWLTGNALQIAFSCRLFYIIYKRKEASKWDCLFILVNALLWLPYNFYSFMINFGYLREEGAYIFCMWFIKNGGMILFSAAVALIILFYRPKPKWKNTAK